MNPAKTTDSSFPDHHFRIVFIRNRFTKSRGEPQLYKISCTSCATPVLLYQKDGPGQLLRCYIDRVHFPKNLVSKSTFTCIKCHTLIGTYMIYKPENRPAFRMIRGTFSKEVL